MTLHCERERHSSVALLRLSGVLDATTAPRARTALIECVADAPSAVVVDVSGLRVADEQTLTMFSTVAHRADDWPGTAVMLCAPEPELADALRRTAVWHAVPVFETQAEALAEALARPPPPRVREVYRPAPDAPSQARSVVTEACAAWGVPEVAGAAQVIVSELVANAVVHARTPLVLSLALRGDVLDISVRDGDRRGVPPRNGIAVDVEAESGRGLLVVTALSSSWGVVRVPDGKVVWASVPVRVPAGRYQRAMF